ncbi:acetylxylan esterase [Bradyrhizobium yuanmingense]|uniref:acetylxylan esterase n=1 Tax=Bradyrhizobium yuanmingense TaxID=108015 RepID=UPI0021A33ACD|nr:acetylxylan esterase [Bradyrhizobium sp. CB1024]UWU83077.1 acetylxylan esterase [Bradyrhizobium sp. CB1024]
MPLVDMPLAQLQQYQGRTPRPEDFDAFWDRSLAEMRSVDPEPELLPAPFKVDFAECFDLFFTGVRGARIHAKLVRPKKFPKRAPAVVRFHGYSSNSGDWIGHLPLAAAGFVIAALDCRGQGGLSEDVGGVKGNTLHAHIVRGLYEGPEKLLFRDIFLDVVQLAGIVMAMPEVDAERVAAEGGSQGGGLSLACAALEPRICRAAATYPLLCDYQRAWEMDVAKDAYQRSDFWKKELRTFFRRFDPTHEHIAKWFRRLGYIDVQHLAARIQGEVLMVTGLMDSISPPSSQFAAYNKITRKKNILIYPDHGHEILPRRLDHVFEFLCSI